MKGTCGLLWQSVIHMLSDVCSSMPICVSQTASQTATSLELQPESRCLIEVEDLVIIRREL